MSPIKTALFVVALLPLAACGTIKKMNVFKATCGKPVDAASVVDRPPLVVPAGRAHDSEARIARGAASGRLALHRRAAEVRASCGQAPAGLI